ncbi:hypothetical protein [Arcobacter sp.]|uniref:hypothetical protein n=1 Tax=Arcobacter sp. TaxID=1872629 RepID=UPI003D120314
MAYTEKEKELITTLLGKIELIEEILTSKGINVSDSYKYIIKVKNILKNKDEKGMKNVKQHLFMDFRQMFESSTSFEELNILVEESFRIAILNSIFNK